MKLTKLSLAAIVAVGALGMNASATPLEEAVKGVDVSGFMRIRYYNSSDTDGSAAGSGNTSKKNNEALRFSGLLTAKVPVTDSLKFVTALATDSYNNPGFASSAAGTEPKFNKFFFQYAANGLTLNAGKFEIPTPWTQAGFTGARGNGVLALYSPVKDWTFAAAAYLQTDSMNRIEGLNATSPANFNDFGKENLYALAAIGKAGPVGVQVWLASMEHVIDYVAFGELSFASGGFNIRGQVNYLDADKDVYDEGSWYAGVEAGYKGKSSDNVAFNLKAGYTYTNKDLLAYALDGDADGFIKFGKQMYYKTSNSPDTQVVFVSGGINVDKFGLNAGFGSAKYGLRTDDDMGFEGYGALTYKYAKNFSLEVYYSHLGGDAYKATNLENDEVRFQADYTF